MGYKASRRNNNLQTNGDKIMKIKVKMLERRFDDVVVEPFCDKAKRFCILTGLNYMNQEHIFHIQKLGFEVEVIQ